MEETINLNKKYKKLLQNEKEFKSKKEEFEKIELGEFCIGLMFIFVLIIIIIGIKVLYLILNGYYIENLSYETIIFISTIVLLLMLITLSKKEKNQKQEIEKKIETVKLKKEKIIMKIINNKNLLKETYKNITISEELKLDIEQKIKEKNTDERTNIELYIKYILE